MRAFKTADGLKTITRHAEIFTSLPVLGFRPIRGRLLRTMKQPNEESLTGSPRSRHPVISLKKTSTSAADWVRETRAVL